ncbi:hypothetical protein ACVWXU_002442 [Streptomyces sp. TE33382]
MNHTDTTRRGLLGALLAGAALSATPAPPARAAAASMPAAAPRATRPLLLGTYTSDQGGGTGIGTATYDTTTGALTTGPVIVGVDNPSYLAAHPSGATVYAVDEQERGGVTAIALAPDGSHRVLGTRGTGGGRSHPSVRAPHGKVAAQRELHLGQRRGAPHRRRRLAG